MSARRYVLIVLSCLMLFVSSASAQSFHPRNADALPARGAWNDAAYKELSDWLSRLARHEPETLLLLIDCDNTAWAGDIADVVFDEGVKKGAITWKTAPLLEGFPFVREGKTPFDYYEHLYGIDPIVAYTYASLAFSGLTLKEVDRLFRQSSKREDFPQVYAEIRALTQFLRTRGIVTGFVSASPFFLVAPMLEQVGYGAPLWAVEGIDAYVADPKHPDKPVLLSNLIQSNGIESWKEVLKRYGHAVIQPRPVEIANAREGKATGGASIAARRVVRWNADTTKQQKLSIGAMRLAGVIGDNFGPFADLPRANPREVGNDQGMLRALPMIDGGLVIDIYRAVMTEGKIDLEKKRKHYENFKTLVAQFPSIGLKAKTTVQVGISKGPARGFVPTSIP